MPAKICDICGSKADVYTDVHKKEPFANGRNYSVVCFTCYFVPKIIDQKYDGDGMLKEEIEIPYGCTVLNSPKDLHIQGAADTLKQAKTSVEAVQAACRGVKTPKKALKRPSPAWKVC